MQIHDALVRTGLEELLGAAVRLCDASGGLVWRDVDGAPIVLAQVGLADPARLVAAVAAAQGHAAEGDLGAPLVGEGGRALGGWCVFGAPVRPATQAVIDGLAGQAATLIALDERLAEQRQLVLEARDGESRLRDVIASMPIVVFVLDRAGIFTLSDGGALDRIGLKPGQVVGLSAFDVYRDFPTIVDNIRAALTGEPRAWTAEVAGVIYETRTIVLRDPAGEVSGILGVAIDITERVAMETRHKQLQEEVIAVQAATLAELSTPMIPITRDTVVLPLIGEVDAARAERMLQTLLEGISAGRARVAILDITGVARMNTQVADCLLRAARAARLLGAEVVLTGVRPEVAQALVGLGVDLGALVTRGTLESGIAWALQRR